MKYDYFIRQEKGTHDVWHGPYEVMPKRKLKSLVESDPNGAYDLTVYRCTVVGVDWDKL
jgi:hypothetical protein